MRRRERAARLLLPLLQEQTEQLQDSLLPPLLQQEELHRQQMALLGAQQEVLRVVTELLQEVLNSLQPDPLEEISRLGGPPPRPSTLPRSAS